MASRMATMSRFKIEACTEHLIRSPMRTGPIRGVGQSTLIGHRGWRSSASLAVVVGLTGTLVGGRDDHQERSKAAAGRSKAAAGRERRPAVTRKRSLQSVCQQHSPRKGVSRVGLASCITHSSKRKMVQTSDEQSPLPSCLRSSFQSPSARPRVVLLPSTLGHQSAKNALP
jgi:hypothetical protein